jgi:hypothetical protein
MPLASLSEYLDTYVRVFDLNHAFPTRARRITANIAKLPECFAKKQQAHRVLRPVGRSLLMKGSNYFCFVVSPFM